MDFSLEDLGLVDAPAEDSFDNLTALAAQIIDAPVSLVSIVETAKDRQFFKSQVGLIEPWSTQRQTPLSHSFCQHVVKNDEALIVENAPEHDVVKDNLAIPDLGVMAYLGVPIYAPENLPVGALCVIDGSPRSWSDRDIDTIRRLSLCVSDLIRMKALVRASDNQFKEQRLFTEAFTREVRTPVKTIRYLLDQVSLDDGISDDGLDLAQDGKLQTDRLMQQLDDVMNYTENCCDTDLDFETVSLTTVFDDILIDLRDEIEDTEAEIRIADMPQVQGSRAQLRSLFANLVGNALKFRAPDRPPKIQVTYNDAANAHGITVQDNGIGISPLDHAKVFDLFVRSRSARDYPGTGVGLTLCRRIAEQHDGSVHVTSVEGRGARFTVLLPKERVDAPVS